MKVEEFNAMSEEEKKAWIGHCKVRVYLKNGRCFVARYDPTREPTPKQKEHREAFARAAKTHAYSVGLTVYRGKKIPSIAARIAEELKRR